MIAALLTAGRALIAAAMPSSATLILYGSIIAGVAGFATYWSVHEYNKGYAAAIAAVAAQDQEAVDAVAKADRVIANCKQSGGVWRQASGECLRR